MSDNIYNTDGGVKRKHSIFIDCIDLTTDEIEVKKIKIDAEPSTSTRKSSYIPLTLPNSEYIYRHVESSPSFVFEKKNETLKTNEETNEHLSKDEIFKRKLLKNNVNCISSAIRGIVRWSQTREKVRIHVDLSHLVDSTSDYSVVMNTHGFKINAIRKVGDMNLLSFTFFKTVVIGKWQVNIDGNIVKMLILKSRPEYWEKCFSSAPESFFIKYYGKNEHDTVTPEDKQKLLDKKAIFKELLSYVTKDYEMMDKGNSEETVNEKPLFEQMEVKQKSPMELQMSTDSNTEDNYSHKDSTKIALSTRDSLNILQPTFELRSDQENETINSLLALQMSTQPVTDFSNDTDSTSVVSSTNDLLNESQYSLKSPTDKTINSLLALQMSANPIAECLSTDTDSPTTVSSTEVSPIVLQPDIPLLQIEDTQDSPHKLKTPINSIPENTSVCMEIPTKAQSTNEPLTHSKEDIENALLIMQLSADQIYVDPVINTEISAKTSSTDILPAVLQSSLELLQKSLDESENSQVALQISTESFTVDPSTVMESPAKASSNEDPPTISNSCFDNEHYKVSAGLSFDSELIPPTFP